MLNVSPNVRLLGSSGRRQAMGVIGTRSGPRADPGVVASIGGALPEIASRDGLLFSEQQEAVALTCGDTIL